MSHFSAVELAPRDPILGLTEQFKADTRPEKVNLGVGMYYDETGKIPLMACVREAERHLAEAPSPRAYLPIDGIAAYDDAIRGLVFGADSDLVRGGRVATVQTLGGTGALKIGADFLKRLYPEALVVISDPSWENHRALFTQAGFPVETYPYYTPGGVNFDGMMARLRQLPSDTIVVLHACCHNPTGYDLTLDQWDVVVEVCASRGLVPFLDLAYQGFAEGIAEDGAAVGRFLAAGQEILVATSFSKSFNLYGERVGGLSLACDSREQADCVLSQLKTLIRTNYSNPPTHGAQVVATVLGEPGLRRLWEEELASMRLRIREMRQLLVSGLQAAGVARDMGFIARQRGMFSYSGLGVAEMQRLRAEHGIYGTDSGRICVAALNRGNIGAVCAAIARVI